MDGRLSGYPAEAFYDKLHLNSAGANTFSADIGDVIRRHLADPTGAPRWVTLPPYRARPLDPGLEDDERSRVVLAEQHARGRR